jgi:hypothetical protein
MRRVGVLHSTWRASAKSKIAREAMLSADSSLRCDDGPAAAAINKPFAPTLAGRSPPVGSFRFAVENLRNDTPGAPIAARPQDAGQTRAVRRATARIASRKFPRNASAEGRTERTARITRPPIRASAITNPVSRTLSRRFREKNFQQPGIVALR